jgi:hypothetical protein
MNKARLNWRKLTALGAVLALTLIQSVSMSRATTISPPLKTTSTDVKLDSELRVLDSFFDDWLKVYKQHGVLSKKASVTSTEFNAFKSSSEGLKNRCSQLEGAIRDIIKKLKEAGRWEGLDDEVLAKANDEKLKSDLREGGGLKHLLEDAASQYCSQAENEITGPVESLRPRVSAQVQDLFFEQAAQDYKLRMVRVAYDPATPMVTKPVRCLGATIRVAVHMVVATHTGPAGSNRQCFCFDRCGSPTS